MSAKRMTGGIDEALRAGMRMSAAVALALATLLAGTRATVAAPAESQVRAAYLLNFVRYTRWPSGSDGPIVVAVLGTPENAAVLRDLASRAGPINGQTVVIRPLVLASIPPSASEATKALAASLGRAQVLYVGPTHQGWAGTVRTVTNGRPVLTVGPGRRFLDQGGMIGMYLDSGNVRFDVNVAAIKASSLDVSARLLVLARPAGG